MFFILWPLVLRLKQLLQEFKNSRKDFYASNDILQYISFVGTSL